MAIALGVQPSNAPLPMGQSWPIRVANYGGIARPAAGNWMWQGPGTVNGMQVGPFQRPYRFCLKVGASYIAYMQGAWERFDWWLRLVVNGGYGNDLNGIGLVQKAMSSEGTSHHDPWIGCSIEALFYCEANTAYHVQELTAGGTGIYYQSDGHNNMWAHTVGEGMF